MNPVHLLTKLLCLLVFSSQGLTDYIIPMASFTVFLYPVFVLFSVVLGIEPGASYAREVLYH